MQRSALYLQTGTPQLRSRKYLPLRHEVERRIISVSQSGAPHFLRKCCLMKRNGAFFCVTKRSAAFFCFRKRNAAFFPCHKAEHRIFSVFRKCVEFRAIIAALRSMTTKRNAAQFQKSEARFTIEYRVFKNL